MENPLPLNEKHHAILFAHLARALVQYLGAEAGEALVRRAVRRYGEQRGQRMAQRALRDGQPLSMTTYLQYKEWRSATGESRSETSIHGRDLISRVSCCPWNNAWLEMEILPYGRLYCLEVDEALVRGFNPELSLSVSSTLSNGGAVCAFNFHEGAGDPPTRPVDETHMPWSFHLAHLVHAFQQTCAAEGLPHCEHLIENALADFAQGIGQEGVAQVLNSLALYF